MIYNLFLSDLYICPKSAGDALIAAAKAGNAIEVRRLLDCPGVDVNHGDTSRLALQRFPDRSINLTNYTSLYLASRKGDEEVVEVLLQHPQVDINFEDYNNRTSLWWASAMGHMQVVKRLLNDSRTDVNKAGIWDQRSLDRPPRSQYQTTPLFAASHAGHAEVVKELMSHPQIDINAPESGRGTTPALIAAKNGHFDIIKMLLSDKRINITQPDKRGSNLFTFYININVPEGGIVRTSPHLLNGQLDIIKMLLSDERINVNQPNKRGFSLLFVASQTGNLDIVEELLADTRVDVNQATDTTFYGYGQTPINMAADNGHVDVVKALLKDNRINVNQQTRYGATPLISASGSDQLSSLYERRLEVVKVLLADPRVDPNLRNRRDESAIAAAVKGGNLEFVQTLLRCPRVITGVKDMHGLSELDYAKEGIFPNYRNMPEILRLRIVDALESRETLLEQGHTCLDPKLTLSKF